MHRISAVATASLIAFSWPLAASANTFDDISDRISQAFNAVTPNSWANEDVKLAVGAGMAAVPDYGGSNNYKVQPLPILEFHMGNFSFQTNEARYVLINAPLRAGIIGRLDLGRNESANRALAGMGGIGTSLELGGFAEGLWHGWVGQFELRQDVLSGHEGLIASLAAGRTAQVTTRLNLIYGVEFTWGDGNYRQAEFGVDPRQAANSGYPVHDLGAGFTDVALRLLGSYNLTPRLQLGGGLSYKRLVGGAADSPLVKGPGSANQIVAGLGFRYTLWRRDTDKSPDSSGL